MGKLRDMANRVINLDLDTLANSILNNSDFQKFIIELNTEDQLFNENIDSRGIRLNDIGGDYSPSIFELSRTPKKSLTDINLKDSGDFYKSFSISVGKKSILIQADTRKGDKDLKDEWGDDILGLTDENLQKVINRLKDLLINELRKTIKG